MFAGRWWPFPSSWLCYACNMVALCLQVAGGTFPHPGTAMRVIWWHYVCRLPVALSLILTLLCV